MRPAQRQRKRSCDPRQDQLFQLEKVCGIQAHCIEVRRSGTGLRGCYSTHSLDKDTIVIRVPDKKTIMEFGKCPLPAPEGIDKKSWRALGSFARIAFHLLQRPDFSAILSTLPRYPDDVDLPFLWRPASLQELSRFCASAHHRVSEERRNWDNSLKALQVVLSKKGFKANDYFTALHAVRTRTFDGHTYRLEWQAWPVGAILTLCNWVAWTLVCMLIFERIILKFVCVPAMMSQVFLAGEWLDRQRQSFCAFIPGLDMLNHSSSEPNAVLCFDKSTGQFQVRCQKHVAEDEELIYRYSDASNDELLFRYGFVEKDNPYDILEVSLQSLLEFCDVSEHVRKLQQHGFDQLRFQRGAAVDEAYVQAIGLNAVHAIARQLKEYLDKSSGKWPKLLESFKREKLRLLDELLASSQGGVEDKS